MRIFAVSDLHLDYLRIKKGLKVSEERELLKTLLNVVLDKNIDIFIFAGDISAKIWEVELFLEVFSSFSGVKVFVPGNHDIWKEGEITSDQKYYKILPKLCKEYGFAYLPFEPIKLNDLVIVGTMGWYDYSFGDSYYDKSDFDRGEYGGIKWREVYWGLARFCNNGKILSNEEVYNLIYDEFKHHLLKIEKGKDKIVVSHFIPFEEILFIKNFFSAYLGSKKFGEIILEHGINKVICGHEHRSGIFSVNGITIYKPTVGYAESTESLLSRYDQNSILIELSDNHRFCVI
ncbi:metallophosphoesterase [Dictyoglomus thermophilum]|uniref:Ser/Thr protein phosphatase family protein n=1 Tax=Dictyoglomus thermophilum (strain ATCC 35947 / DSM 3960 / H-6-12) TaxID=309799 RepID=B5YCZ7_DICT6|nr:metallophosphoesterase [Dictyoglomus thermophilum]ACI18716.1 Ser/Thr protein phosphatase family protein [Dictyoglomus thermophilum H-6-12]